MSITNGLLLIDKWYHNITCTDIYGTIHRIKDIETQQILIFFSAQSAVLWVRDIFEPSSRLPPGTLLKKYMFLVLNYVQRKFLWPPYYMSAFQTLYTSKQMLRSCMWGSFELPFGVEKFPALKGIVAVSWISSSNATCHCNTWLDSTNT